ncbi:MAG: tetratricopeptide repeat protein [Anaerolineales bacterium]|nr:tetratricopeptide repeat protein [Anaerolineales bacterium]MCB0011599.1 tetratricopeptide repeat protein [Anaerolineales bacterium]MCB8963282.1 tetratricopeptide repeat protein [Ardenticatenales bacterium]
MSEIAREKALVLVDQAQRLQFRGAFSEAIQLYRRSIDMYPTAEAYTYLGWTYSMMSRYEDAIAVCEQAIAVDPAFGNPYNDIGAYLIELDRPEEAIPWLEKATTAERYDERQFPLINLGRIYEQLGKYRTALDYYNQALAIDPFDAGARLAKYGLLGQMN